VEDVAFHEEARVLDGRQVGVDPDVRTDVRPDLEAGRLEPVAVRDGVHPVPRSDST
jgi:hypothetical protein